MSINEQAKIILRELDKEYRMLKPIIPIDRAPENWVNALIDAGILIVTEDGIRCAEPQGSVALDTSQK